MIAGADDPWPPVPDPWHSSGSPVFAHVPAHLNPARTGLPAVSSGRGPRRVRTVPHRALDGWAKSGLNRQDRRVCGLIATLWKGPDAVVVQVVGDGSIRQVVAGHGRNGPGGIGPKDWLTHWSRARLSTGAPGPAGGFVSRVTKSCAGWSKVPTATYTGMREAWPASQHGDSE